MPENIDDLAIPEIKLIQSVGGDEAKQQGAVPGDFYCSMTGEIIHETGFDIVVTGPAKKTRTYWGRSELTDEPPECSSEDGVMSVNGDVCATSCPNKAYNDAPYMLAADQRRAACLPNYHIVGIMLSNMMPVMIRCSGISSQAAKELNTLLMFHKAVRANPLKAKICVTAVKKKTASGEAYALKFSQPSPISEREIIQELAEIGETLLGIPAAPPMTEIPAENPQVAPVAPEPQATQSKSVEKRLEVQRLELPPLEEPPADVQTTPLDF